MGKLKDILNLSPITLGTMRFYDKGMSLSQVTSLIEAAFEIGINSHHSSFEYSSYELYSKALKTSIYTKKVKHIVKLSSPHFDEEIFSSGILEKKVDHQLRSLNIDSIDVLQWLVRSTPINDKDRIFTLENQKEEISECLANLKKKGKIKSCFSFPYSVDFARKVTVNDEVDGLITYLNKKEKEYVEFANSTPFIAIRPFCAGKLIENSKSIDFQIIDNLKFVENHKNVISTIVGINSLKQLETYKKHLN